tara:strand:+ start:941 stop:1357 length:417 start_codon:yes stop_codon:yes gene_type:complete
MFTSFSTIPSISGRAGGVVRAKNMSIARTVFSQENGTRCILITFNSAGKRGNGYVANLVRMLESGSRYKFRLFSPAGATLNTLTVNGVAGATLAATVAAINADATISLYVTATLINDSTQAFNSNVNISNGQTLRGGR